MNKAEFLKYLEKRLVVLNQKEREDIINEYAQHIEMKIKSGLSEEEAIKDFGNLGELTDEILSAYNVDPNYKKSTIDTEKVEKTIHSGVGIIKKLFSKLANILYSSFENIQEFSIGDIIKSIIKNGIILAFLLIILIIGGTVVFGFSDWIYQILPDIMFVDDIISFGLIMFYLIISAVIFIGVIFRLFKNKLLIKTQKEEKIISPCEYAENSTEENILKTNTNNDITINSLWNLLKRIIIFCIKVAALFYVIPYGLFLLFTVVLMGALIVFMFMGYPVIGLVICSLGFNLSGISLFVVIVKYLYFNKCNKEVVADEK